MYRIQIFWVLLVLLLFNMQEAFAQQGRSPSAARTVEYIYGYEIHPNCIKTPLSKYLLIKYKNGKYGAVKFIAAEKSDAKEEAVYEWWFGIDENGKFTDKDSKTGTAQVSFKLFPVLGRFAIQTGNPWIKFGSIKLNWSAPTWIYFEDDNRAPVAELAPTNELDIRLISVFDSNIKWFQMDPYLVKFHRDLELRRPR